MKHAEDIELVQQHIEDMQHTADMQHMEHLQHIAHMQPIEHTQSHGSLSSICTAITHTHIPQGVVWGGWRGVLAAVHAWPAGQEHSQAKKHFIF